MIFIIDTDYLQSLLDCDKETAEEVLKNLSSWDDYIKDQIDDQIKQLAVVKFTLELSAKKHKENA